MKIVFSIVALTLVLAILIFIMLRTADGFNNYYGVGRWDSKIYASWQGTKMYPVSKNCTCSDNHDFVDNNCINRDYPYNASQPFCYDNLE